MLSLLNDQPNCNFKLHSNKYSSYDIGGTKDDTFCIIEVKERRQMWNTLYIETKRIEDMFHQAKTEGFNWETGIKYLCVSVDGEHYFYNVDVITQSPRVWKKMNATTASGFRNQGEKVNKEVFEFESRLFDFKLGG